MPSPYPIARCAWFSPVPNHTVSGFFGSTVTHPSEYDPPSSKIGWKLTPWLTVFHKPPDAVATYQMLRFRGSTATSAMRPEVKVPVMLRIASSVISSGVSRGADPCCASSVMTIRGRVKYRVRFMVL